MANPPSLEQLDFEWRQLETRFQDFHQMRDLDGPWNQLRRRELLVDLQPELKAIQEGINFSSPDLEKATSDWKAILKLEPTFMEFKVPGLSQQARDTERDLSLFFRRGWDYQNKGRLIDDRVAEGQIIHGLKVERKCFKPFAPPEGKDGLPQPFYFENVLIDGMYWPGGLMKEDAACWYRYSVSVVESGITKKGEKLNLDPDNNIGWLGADDPYDYSASGQKKVHVIVRDWPAIDGTECPLEGCDHPQRYITTYVCPEGEGMEKAEVVETITSPFKTNSFYAIGGLLMQTERNPSLVYRPLILPLYELIHWKNYLVTLLAVLVRAEAKDDSYLDVSRAAPEVVAQTIAAEGGNTTSVDRPDPAPNQMATFPGTVTRYPKITSEHLVTLINQCDKMIEEYKPNRYLVGNADVQTSNGTASALMAQTQAAALVPAPLLAELDTFIERSVKDEMHAYRYWDHCCPDGVTPRWVVTVTGQENVMRGKGKAGEQIYIDAKKVNCDPDLLIQTGNDTLSEKQIKWTIAKDQFLTGVLQVEQLIRAAGIYDVQLQLEGLFADRVDQSLEPLEMRMAQLVLTRRAAIKTGYDFGQLLGQQPASGPDVPGAPPALPTGPQQGAPPQSSAPNNPSPNAGAMAHSNNPQTSVPAPAIAGPQGGNLGTGGV